MKIRQRIYQTHVKHHKKPISFTIKQVGVLFSSFQGKKVKQFHCMKHAIGNFIFVFSHFYYIKLK